MIDLAILSPFLYNVIAYDGKKGRHWPDRSSRVVFCFMAQSNNALWEISFIGHLMEGIP